MICRKVSVVWFHCHVIAKQMPDVDGCLLRYKSTDFFPFQCQPD